MRLYTFVQGLACPELVPCEDANAQRSRFASRRVHQTMAKASAVDGLHARGSGATSK